MATCDCDELALLEYLLGAAPPDLHAQIVRQPACVAAAHQLTITLATMYRFSCPDVPTLVAYQEQRVADATLQLVLHQHVAGCLHCAEELTLLGAIDAVPLLPLPSPARRMIEAVVQSPLLRPQPLRGDLLQYTVEQISIQLRVRPQIDRRGVWTVRGQLRAVDGQLATNLVESVCVRSSAVSDQPIVGAVETQGAFRFDGLLAGVYALEIDTAECTIVIKQLHVGN